DLVELDEAGDGDRSRVVRRRKGLEVGVLDEDELALRYLPALDDLVVRDLAVVLGAPALVLDRRPALAVQHPERHVRLPGSRSRGARRREPWTSSPTGCWRAESAGATLSGSSAGRGSSGHFSTSRSRSLAGSPRPSTQTARPTKPPICFSMPRWWAGWRRTRPS